MSNRRRSGGSRQTRSSAKQASKRVHSGGAFTHEHVELGVTPFGLNFEAPVDPTASGYTPPLTEMVKLLTPTEVADFLRVRVELLAKWRSSGVGPPSVKIGRYVRYVEAELAEWLDTQLTGAT